MKQSVETFRIASYIASIVSAMVEIAARRQDQQRKQQYEALQSLVGQQPIMGQIVSFTLRHIDQKGEDYREIVRLEHSLLVGYVEGQIDRFADKHETGSQSFIEDLDREVDSFRYAFRDRNRKSDAPLLSADDRKVIERGAVAVSYQFGIGTATGSNAIPRIMDERLTPPPKKGGDSEEA